VNATTVMSTGRLWSAYLREIRHEFLKSLRTPAFAVPTLFFPVMFYVLFGVFLGAMRGHADQALITFATFGVFGAMGPGLFGFGVSLAIEREQGLLTLKQALPQPPGAYLIARAFMAMLFVAVISVLLTIMAVSLGKVPLTAGQVVQLFLINTLGALPFCAIGMYMGSLVSGQASPAIINFVFLPMAFLSGLFVPLQFMPAVLQNIAPVWPAFHLAQMALQTVGAPSTGAFAMHVAVLTGMTLFFFLLAVKRMHGSGFRLLGSNPKRAVALAAGVAAIVIALSFTGVFGARPDGATAAPDAASVETPAPAATAEAPAAEPAPAIPVLADFDNGSERTAYGNGMLASGDEAQNGKSTAAQKVIDGGARGSKSALEVTGEVRSGAQYPTAGTFFFPTGEIMKASLDISAKKALSFQVRGDGKQYTLMIFTAGSYIPIMQPFSTGTDWQEVKLELARHVGADFKHVRGFGIVSMAMGPFQFQIDDLRLE
jgi:ABC-2 type transport system permease protein